MHLATGNFVERILHPRREFVVHVRLKMLFEKSCNDPAGVGRDKPAPVHIDVLTPHQCLDDAGVGRGPADSIVFQRFYQAGL
jgi:hypothetical protein